MPLRLLLLLLLAPAVLAQSESAPPRNLIIMIADGAGPATFTLGREVGGAPLALDAMLRGAVRVASASHPITDSAASATAYAAGIKTKNRTVGVDTLGQPVGTILEAAEARGLATGIVTTSPVTDATPASFTAHNVSRYAENAIAAEQLGQGLEVILGGGRQHFLPQSGGQREDGRNLLTEAEALGYTVVATPEELEAAEAPVLGLFAPGVMAKVIDRDASQPTLAAMTDKALGLLSADPDGFILVVETEGTDEAGHANDPAALAREVLAYDDAVRVALDFARADGRTLVVSLADHETGGLGLGLERGYVWDPAYLRRVTASAGEMLRLVSDGAPIADVLRDYAAIDTLSSDEQAYLHAEWVGERSGVQMVRDRVQAWLRDRTDRGQLNTKSFSRLMSRRARVGWTTGSHTAVDVGLYAWGPGAERFGGVMENDAVGRALADLLGLDLAAVTARLRAEATDTGP